MEDLNVTPPPPPPAEKKNTGAIVGTIVAAVLCGCPGLAAACSGLIQLIGSFIPSSGIDLYGTGSDTNMAMIWGAVGICGGLIFIAIPVVIAIVTLRKKKEKAPEEILPAEPLPPVS